MPEDKDALWMVSRVRVRKPAIYCDLINSFPALEYTGISSKVLENLDYELIFGAGFLLCLNL